MDDDRVGCNLVRFSFFEWRTFRFPSLTSRLSICYLGFGLSAEADQRGCASIVRKTKKKERSFDTEFQARPITRDASSCVHRGRMERFRR